jgi:hypothetical protein
VPSCRRRRAAATHTRVLEAGREPTER